MEYFLYRIDFCCPGGVRTFKRKTMFEIPFECINLSNYYAITIVR